MSKYIQKKAGEKIKSETAVVKDVFGGKSIYTEFTEKVTLGKADVSGVNLELNVAKKGSVKLIQNEDGSLGIRVNPYGVNSKRTPAEVIRTTEHGRLVQNGRVTRLVFEFPRRATFSSIADHLDDEVYEIRSWLEDHAFGSQDARTERAAFIKAPEASALPTGLTGVKSVGGPKRKEGGEV